MLDRLPFFAFAGHWWGQS